MQSYAPGTLTCSTVLAGADSRISIDDVMPWDGSRPAGRIVRLVTALRGPAEVDIEVVPGRAFAPAADVSAWSEGVTFDGTVVRTGVAMEIGLSTVGGGRDRVVVARGRVRLDTGDRMVVTVDPPSDSGRPSQPLSPDRAAAVLARTATAWHRVLAPAVIDGSWAELAARSLLVLRALSMVSAPTTSLPEVEGGERTADGRIVRSVDVAGWAANSSAAGLAEEADAAAAWLLTFLDSIPVPDVLGLDGSAPGSERLLPLTGWRCSQPVRVGHDAPDEPSIESACAVLACSAALAGTSAGEVLLGRWDRLVSVTDWVAEHWAAPDRGRWGLARPTELVAGRLAARHALAAATAVAWRRNPLDLDAAGWHAARLAAESSLVAAAAPRGVLASGRDAAVLRVAWLGPWPADDPVVGQTLLEVRAQLKAGPWLLAYPPELDDGRPGTRAASVVATLWLVRALAATGQWEEANLTMEAVAALAGPLGLLPEWVDPTTGRARGNRPSGAAHVAFLEAARELAAGPR